MLYFLIKDNNMFRISKKPIVFPKNILVKIKGRKIFFQKNKLKIVQIIHSSVIPILKNKNEILLKLNDNFIKNKKYIGTTRSIIFNIIQGIIYGFSKKLLIIGVGYKAFIKDNILNLSLGFSHIIKYNIPINVDIYCPNSNEIIIKSWDKQLVGCVAAKIRSFRVPEHYKKGKGIRYWDEKVRIKEHKKKISK